MNEWTPVPAPADGPGFAERLGDWVSAFDAIGLQAVHQSIKTLTAPASPARTRQPRPDALLQDVARARQALVHAMQADPNPLGETGYAPWQRRHAELQRQMDQMLGALRDHVRHTLARAASLQMRRLATLDAAMEHVLAPREQSLYPHVAAALGRRFADLRQRHVQAGETPGDDVAAARRPGGWLHAFEHDWRMALEAELDLRLEPVTGLAEAWAHDDMDTAR